MRLLFAAAECSPYARTGGLGDAVAGLAKAMASLGHDVTVAIPDYGRDPGGWSEADVGTYTVARFAHELFSRPGIYGQVGGPPYPDNWRRFGTFAKAVAAFGDDFDLVHLHDAHVGPAALAVDVPAVFTIHNAAYPLLGPLEDVQALLGLPDEAATPTGPLEWFGQANFLKAGVVGAEQVTTVSPTHARELLEPSTSFGLADLLRSLPRPLVGILNGIDAEAWDPASDPALDATFTADDPTGRSANRVAVLDRFGLDDGFLLGNVGRMSAQKGLGLLEFDLDTLVDEGARFVFIGAGELDAMVDGWVDRHPRAVAHRRFDEAVARLVFAGVDAYLMPSEFEPCGLGQMYAMRYGAVPIVHLTGGLADTVVDIDEDPHAGTGFGFRTFAHEELTKTVRRARRYHGALPALWRVMVGNGMTRDWSWTVRAGQYVELYRELVDLS